jgi:hypothetical protein
VNEAEVEKEKFAALRKAYPGSKLLIVSNTAGTSSGDGDDALAKMLEANTGVKVLRHGTKVRSFSIDTHEINEERSLGVMRR